MTLLTICQNAAGSIGLNPPGTIIGNTNQDARALLAFAKEELESLARAYNWPVLIREGYIELNSGFRWFDVKAANVVMTDVDRFVPDTVWDRDLRRQAYFPTTSQEWAFWTGTDFIVSSLSTRMRWSYGPTQGALAEHYAIEVLEPLTAADNGRRIHLEYLSKNVVRAVDATAKATWTVDTDTSVLSEFVQYLGVVWRYKASKGMDYAKDEQKYNRELEKYKASVRGSKSMNMQPRSGPWPFRPTVPDLNYGP